MRILRLVFLGIICALLVTVFVQAEDIPPAKGKYSETTLCVEPVDIMRKQHFEFILDHRDRTVIEGIRTTQYSLKNCIDCHIPMEGWRGRCCWGGTGVRDGLSAR